jgi:hypothetical protein
VAAHLDEGHVVRALRLSSRLPDPAARFSAELATRLRDAASAALAPSTPADKWLATLEALIESPVRRTVKPEGLPAAPTAELLEMARQQCGRVPSLAPLLGSAQPPHQDAPSASGPGAKAAAPCGRGAEGRESFSPSDKAIGHAVGRPRGRADYHHGSAAASARRGRDCRPWHQCRAERASSRGRVGCRGRGRVGCRGRG